MRRLAALFLAFVLSASALPAKATHKGNFGIAGWLVYWDPKSMETFERNAALIDRVYPEMILAGALLVSLFAILVDAVMALVERVLTPTGIQIQKRLSQ